MDQAVASASTQSTKSSRPSRGEWLTALLIIAALVAVTRASAFGNPVYQTDDQFYLYVGGAMLDGQLPYVEIWDRKPLGLFLIYAGIAALGGSGIEQYQVVAGIFVWLTALVIWRFGHRISNYLGGLAGAAAYLVTLPVFGGAGGQSPLFYNLFIALAAYLVFAKTCGTEAERSGRGDYLAMLLAGLALTIKTSSVVEGAFFGLWLLGSSWNEQSWLQRLAYAAKLALIALAPTALCILAYALMGHANEYLFANFISIFLKDNIGSRWSYVGIKSLLIFLTPMLAAFLAGVFLSARKDVDTRTRLFVGLWGLAAFAGALIIPNLYNHYFLPLLVPLAVGAAIAMRSIPTAAVWLALIGWTSWMNGNIRDIQTREAKAEYAALAASVDSELGNDRTLFLFDGPTILYRTVHATPMSRIVLPDHFMSRRETSAMGISRDAELDRILQRRPKVIVTQLNLGRDTSPTAAKLVSSAIQRDYHLTAIRPVHTEGSLFTYLIWARNS